MSKNPKNSSEANYFSGGLAELVSSPSILTYSFLQNWFTGNHSLGKAMQILGLPYRKTNLPLLSLVNNELLINLDHEEQTLYQDTIFTYSQQATTHQTPHLAISIPKIFRPICLINTLKILMVQSKWIQNPHHSVELAKQLIAPIQDAPQFKSISQIDAYMGDHLWPAIIAIGFISEFYNQLINREVKTKTAKINAFISSQLAASDWFFQSLASQHQVKNGRLTFTEYLNHYGLRADDDYELSCPRWHEITSVIKKRIAAIPDSVPNATSKTTPHALPPQAPAITADIKLEKLVSVSIQLQLLRSEAKRNALHFVDLLRQKIIQKNGSEKGINQLTREDLLKDNLCKLPVTSSKSINRKVASSVQRQTSGQGITVSQGKATGKAMYIQDNNINIPAGIIGIFPNASPQFSTQFPKCNGLIFLRGGQTSHGSILAREFKIPAIIDNEAAGIIDKTKITINGSTGRWRSA